MDYFVWGMIKDLNYLHNLWSSHQFIRTTRMSSLTIEYTDERGENIVDKTHY